MSTSILNPQTTRSTPTRHRTARSRLADAFARLAEGIDTHPVRAFAALTLLYLVAVASLSSMKLLWLDELITLHIARLNSVPAIWNALAKGADPNPPLTHIAVMLCRRLFGEREFALRLPAVFGYWIGMLSLFLFLKRRLPPTWALAGTLMSMSMGGFEWSYESRSYAIFYGFTMIAFYFWSRIAEDHSALRHRHFFLLGMTLALALGLCTNYFSVLAFFPIAAGELTRTIVVVRRRSVDRSKEGPAKAIRWHVWIALGVAATPLLLFRSLIETSIAKFAPYAWNKVDFDRVIYGYLDMVEIVMYPLLALLALAIVFTWLGTFCQNCRRSMRPALTADLAEAQTRYASGPKALKTWEAIAVLILMAYPFLGYAVAEIRGGMLSPRFVIPVCLGFAIAGVISAHRLFGHLRGAGIAVLAFFVTWFIARESYIGYWYVEQK